METLLTPDGLTATQTSVNIEPRVKIAQFGDGMNQRSADGINTIVPLWSCSITDIDEETQNAYDQFFADHMGFMKFLWTAPNKSVAETWICKKWSLGFSPGDLRSISFELTRVFI